MRKIGFLLGLLTTAFITQAQNNCPPGEEELIVKCNGNLISRCVPSRDNCGCANWHIEFYHEENYPNKAWGSYSGKTYKEVEDHLNELLTPVPDDPTLTASMYKSYHLHSKIYCNDTKFCNPCSGGANLQLKEDLKKRAAIFISRFYKEYSDAKDRAKGDIPIPGNVINEFNKNLDQSEKLVKKFEADYNNLNDACLDKMQADYNALEKEESRFTTYSNNFETQLKTYENKETEQKKQLTDKAVPFIANFRKVLNAAFAKITLDKANNRVPLNRINEYEQNLKSIAERLNDFENKFKPGSNSSLSDLQKAYDDLQKDYTNLNNYKSNYDSVTNGNNQNNNTAGNAGGNINGNTVQSNSTKSISGSNNAGNNNIPINSSNTLTPQAQQFETFRQNQDRQIQQTFQMGATIDQFGKSLADAIGSAMSSNVDVMLADHAEKLKLQGEKTKPIFKKIVSDFDDAKKFNSEGNISSAFDKWIQFFYSRALISAQGAHVNYYFLNYEKEEYSKTLPSWKHDWSDKTKYHGSTEDYILFKTQGDGSLYNADNWRDLEIQNYKLPDVYSIPVCKSFNTKTDREDCYEYAFNFIKDCEKCKRLYVDMSDWSGDKRIPCKSTKQDVYNEDSALVYMGSCIKDCKVNDAVDLLDYSTTLLWYNTLKTKKAKTVGDLIELLNTNRYYFENFVKWNSEYYKLGGNEKRYFGTASLISYFYLTRACSLLQTNASSAEKENLAKIIAELSNAVGVFKLDIGIELQQSRDIANAIEKVLPPSASNSNLSATSVTNSANQVFPELLAKVKPQEDEQKIATIKQELESATITSLQLTQLLRTFHVESNAIEAAKYALPKVTDKNNLSVIRSAFSFDSSLKEIDKLLSNYK